MRRLWMGDKGGALEGEGEEGCWEGGFIVGGGRSNIILYFICVNNTFITAAGAPSNHDDIC